jgi:hypothetical protein
MTSTWESVPLISVAGLEESPQPDTTKIAIKTRTMVLDITEDLHMISDNFTNHCPHQRCRQKSPMNFREYK